MCPSRRSGGVHPGAVCGELCVDDDQLLPLRAKTPCRNLVRSFLVPRSACCRCPDVPRHAKGNGGSCANERSSRARQKRTGLPPRKKTRARGDLASEPIVPDLPSLTPLRPLQSACRDFRIPSLRQGCTGMPSPHHRCCNRHNDSDGVARSNVRHQEVHRHHDRSAAMPIASSRRYAIVCRKGSTASFFLILRRPMAGIMSKRGMVSRIFA